MEQINDMVVNLRDMAANNSTRILICICIDASNSMNQRMKEINRGVMQFLQGIADNICAADAAESVSTPLEAKFGCFVITQISRKQLI